ncbi:unnamed protein product [Cuscuta epithymum]|uniref:ENTH domain-containing protein n=1 Tax=Cuscuta epithymum TaxID=186058 RepID=A0AAV0CDG2_9ASTE|nr:unnamed protein product [Cuscuta epithymum]
MAPSKLKKAIGAMKDQTSISLAKVGSLSDLEVAIVKVTRHEEYPAEERHVREILNLTRFSRAHVAACVAIVSKRLGKTKNWAVAIKALMLIHRLLNDGDAAYEQEIFFATRRGTRLLNMCDFRDSSRSEDSWDFSAFVRTYALYLDEQLELRMQNHRRRRKQRGRRLGYDDREADEEEVAASPLQEMKIEMVYSRIHHHVQILQRFLACKPTGCAKRHRLVSVALYPVVKESFAIYHEMAQLLGLLMDRFMDLSIPESVKVHEIFCRVAKQFDELRLFYTWSRSIGIARSSDYPDDVVTLNDKLDLMDDLIREKSEWKRRSSNEVSLQEANDPDPLPANALPPPPPMKEVEEKEEEEIGDLLDSGDGGAQMTDAADQLALALFDCAAAAAAPSAAGDWETVLVESASYLSNSKAQLPGGFDTLLLDGLYQQGSINRAATGVLAMGSASSVATVAPQGYADPFAASLSIPPPPYVQMSEMEKKQRLLVEEKLLWQQYAARDGMGLGFPQINHNFYPYTPTY